MAKASVVVAHVAAIVLAGTSVQAVSRWVGRGARTVAAVKVVAGVAVMLGGAYFLWTST